MNTMIFSRRSPVPDEDDAIKVIGNNKSTKHASQRYLPCSSWIKEDYDSLPNIPVMYPIERTNTVVQCSDPHLIADRILRCLQKLSITASFNSSDVSC
jgi:hypothetical protein